MADETLDELERQIRRQERIADQFDDEMRRELRKVITRYVKNVKSVLLDELVTEDARDVLDGIKVANDLRRALEDAGMNDLLDSYDEKFPELAKEALDYFKQFDIEPRLTGTDVDVLDAFVRYSTGTLAELADDRLVKPMRNAIISSTLGGRERSTVVKEITDLINNGSILRKDGAAFTEANINTFVGDSYRQFQRETMAVKAEEAGLNEFVRFSGPNDAKTSEQCQFLLAGADGTGNGVWPKEQFTQDLHPALRANPIILGGHYNCRHTVFPIDRRYAERLGYQG